MVQAAVINRRLEVPFKEYLQPDASYLDKIEQTVQAIFQAIINAVQQALDFVTGTERKITVKTPHCSYNAVSIHPKKAIPAKEAPRLLISIDGGGVRGIIPITILAILEEKYNIKFAKIPGVSMAGSSAGGLIALALNTPSEADPQEPRFTAQGVVGLFTTFAQKVFANSYWHTVSSIFGLRTAKYGSPRQIIQSLVGESKLSACISKVNVTSFDLLTGNTVLFTNQSQKDLSALKNRGISQITVADDVGVDFAATATSAAPTYFPSLGRYVDGGVGANNPALLATLTALAGDGKEQPLHVFSLATGKTAHEPITEDKDQDLGDLPWVEPLITYLLDGSQNLADVEMGLLADTNPKLGYTRLQVLLENDEEAELDNASPANLERLKELATKVWDDFALTPEGQKFIKLLETIIKTTSK